jgi:hypothetical protein
MMVLKATKPPAAASSTHSSAYAPSQPTKTFRSSQRARLTDCAALEMKTDGGPMSAIVELCVRVLKSLATTAVDGGRGT